MDPRIIKNLLILGTVTLLAIFLGFTIADADYLYLAMLIYGAVGIAAVVTPGTSALLAVGLLAPFSLPLPVIRGFPFILLITMLCFLKLFLSRVLTNQNGRRLPSIRLHWMIGLFFGWVALRYCMDPVLPNIRGGGTDVTGFRSFMHFGTSFLLMIGMPWFLPDRQTLEQFLRWCGRISLGFSILLILMTFLGGNRVMTLFSNLGMFVTTFDNGMLRFVTLPGFGIMLISLALIPNLLSMTPAWRRIYLLVGLTAVLVGGSRSGFLMLYALVFAIALGHRRLLQLASWTVIFAACFFMFRYIGDRILPQQENVGVLRILSIASAKVAQRTDAYANTLWRQARWERAVQEIKMRPLLGGGYGGLENAFIFASREDYERSRIEVDVASGNIHNGFLSAAMSLGIPAGLLFIAILARQLLLSAISALQERTASRPFVFSFHTFALAHLSVLVVSILIGTDISREVVWWWIQFAALPAYLPALRSSEPETRSGGELSGESEVQSLPFPEDRLTV